jgi:hypothetical protein
VTRKEFRLPQIDKLLREPVLQQTIERLHIRRELAARHARLHVDQTRQDLISGRIAEDEPSTAARDNAGSIAADLEQLCTQAGIKKVLNGTGVSTEHQPWPCAAATEQVADSAKPSPLLVL